MADNIVETIFVKLGLDGSEYNKGVEQTTKQSDKLNKTVKKTDDLVSAAAKAAAKFLATFAAVTGIAKLINEVQKLNEELYHLEKNLGMSSRTISNWQNASAAMGGSADGMTSSVKSLNMAMNDFVMFGDTSLMQFTNQLGVSLVDTNGKLRDTDKVMLDLADSFSKMDREQAFSVASKMGIDEGTFNTLVQGREEMEKMLEYQNKIYKSSEEELKASRELAKNRALLGTHWESLKLMMGNILVPLFVKLSKVMLGMFEYLQEHQREVKMVFTGIAFAVTAVLIPALIKGTIAALAFMAPFLPFIATVTALGAAFALLYDDYKAWADGGNSLFNWGAFTDYIDNARLTTENLSKAFKNLGKDLMNDTIPTLVGYAEIIQKLSRGDFAGAAAQFGAMAGNFSDKVTGYVDTALGYEQGTTSNKIGETISNIVNGGGKGGVPQANYKSKNFTADKAASIARVAKNIGVNPNDLAAVISFETGGTFSPSAKNKNSSATGLIQFMAGSGGTKGKYYGMSREQFAGLSFDEQMKYVERYYKERGFKAGKSQTTADVYGAVTGYGYKRGSRAYELNKVWDSNKNGIIEKGEMVKNPSFRAHQRNYYDGATNAQAMARQGQYNIPNTLAKPQGSNVRTDVNVQNVTIQTTANTMTGTGQDMAKGIGSQVGMLIPTTR